MKYENLQWEYVTNHEPLIARAVDEDGKVYCVPASQLPDGIEIAPCTVQNPGD